MPPIVTTERIIRRLTDRVSPAGIARIEVGMFRPRDINLGVIVITDSIGVVGCSSLDLLRGESILNIFPGQIVIPAVGREQCSRRCPFVVTIPGVNNDYSFPIAVVVKGRLEY